jgi:hypothetical protein
MLHVVEAGMNTGSNKKRMVYLFFTVIALLVVTDYCLDKKYKAKTSTNSLPKENHTAKNEKSIPAGNEAPAVNNVESGNKKKAMLSAPNRKVDSVPVKPRSNREMLLAKEKMALAAMKKAVNLNPHVKAERENKYAKNQKGALVIYNRVPEIVKVNVIKPDGKKFEKMIQPLKSLQMDVPMGIYSIQASDSKNNTISNGKVTISDELGAAYYVKL